MLFHELSQKDSQKHLLSCRTGRYYILQAGKLYIATHTNDQWAVTMGKIP